MRQVFRIHRGSVLHVIHETNTGHNRVNNVYVLCRNDPVHGERDRGSATCPECVDLDNPCILNRGEMSYLARVAGDDPALRYGGDSNAKRMLLKRDLIDRNDKLTRRGKILADDWLKRPAPAASVSGIVHARMALANSPRCGHGGVLDGFDRMTVDKYAKIRALDLHITCIQCLHQPT